MAFYLFVGTLNIYICSFKEKYAYFVFGIINIFYSVCLALRVPLLSSQQGHVETVMLLVCSTILYLHFEPKEC